MKINDNESRVLTVLASRSGWDECYLYFRTIASLSGMDESAVRRACRSLRKKGLAEYASGLVSDDGGVAGSGYGASSAGVELINTKDTP